MHVSNNLICYGGKASDTQSAPAWPRLCYTFRRIIKTTHKISEIHKIRPILSTALQEISYFIRQEKKKKTLLGFEKTIILDSNIQVYLTTLALFKKKKKKKTTTTRTRTRGEKGKQRRKTNPLYYIYLSTIKIEFSAFMAERLWYRLGTWLRLCF
jgi:hypothetical protein